MIGSIRLLDNYESPWRDRRLWSLWDMINVNIRPLCALCSEVRWLETSCKEEQSLDTPISEEVIEHVKGWMKVAETVATEFEWKAVHDRIERINKRLERPMSHRDLGTEARVLRETIDSGLKEQLVYRYPQEKNNAVLSWQEQWKGALAKFPLAATDIFSGMDLWALGHPTASIFHFMRVLEHGLRNLAAEVNLTFDTQQWHTIIEQIESTIRKERAAPQGIQKSERLQFLSEAAKEFFYFKDGWRNYVSHGRGVYDEYQARSVLEHVKSFMNLLGNRLGETGASPPEQPS